MGKTEVDEGYGIGVGAGAGDGEESGNEETVSGGGENGEREVRETAAEEGDEVKKRNGVAFCHEGEDNNMMMRRLGN